MIDHHGETDPTLTTECHRVARYEESPETDP